MSGDRMIVVVSKRVALVRVPRVLQKMIVIQIRDPDT